MRRRVNWPRNVQKHLCRRWRLSAHRHRALRQREPRALCPKPLNPQLNGNRYDLLGGVNRRLH
jgi:hypothetical protein